MARISNKQMVEELQKGDRLGCVHLLDTYQEMLLNEAARVFHIPMEDAEEIVSDTMLVVVQKVRGFKFKRGDGDFHLWVMTIFRNRVRDYVRYQVIHGGFIERFADDVEEDENLVGAVVGEYQRQLYQEAHASPDASPLTQKLQAIADVLDEMETWERVLLRCRALDVPYEDIAGYTGRPVKQLKVYHARVKTKFIKLLASRYPELQKSSTGVEVYES